MTVSETDELGKQSQKNDTRNFDELHSVRLINCGNILDVNGVLSLPTSGYLNLSILNNDDLATLNTFLNTSFLNNLD